MGQIFDSFHASHFELLDGLSDAYRVAIASAYGRNDGRAGSDDSGGWINARRDEGAGGGAAAAAKRDAANALDMG
jgi:hypothetical protein